MIKITFNDKPVLFRCDKTRQECKNPSCRIPGDSCEHTSDLEHAIWNGEKEFYSFAGEAFFEA